MKQIFAILTGLMLVMPAMLLSSNAYAGSDRSYIAEFMIGLGVSRGNKGFALRLGKDDGEVHVAHWWGDEPNTAIGIGYVANTEGSGQKGNDEWHASGTVGLSYIFRTQSSSIIRTFESPIYFHTSHFQPYFRVAVGRDLKSDGDLEFELSYSRYGLEYAEHFGGFGLKDNDRYDNDERYVGPSSIDEIPCGGTCDDDDDDDDDDCKPGFGFGDRNNCHDGPPGLN